MKIKSVTCEYISKPLKELQIGDRVLGVDGDRPKILNIQKNGVQPTFLIKLSDGRSFRAGKGHFNTVHFRNSKLRPDKKVYDVLTVEYIKDHLNEYLFEIPTDDTFNLNEVDFWQHLEMLPCHENAPADPEDIVPDFNKDPNKVYIESIVPNEDEECWCLQLNDPLGLFAIEDRVFTHNSLLTNLCMSYIITLFGLMREPHKMLGHSAMTSYSQPYGTLVQLKDNTWKPIECLIVGDELKPILDKESRVTTIIEQGEQDTYELDFGNNKKIRCSLGHWWLLWDFEMNKYVKIQTKNFIENKDRYGVPELEDLKRDRNLIIECHKQFEKDHMPLIQFGFEFTKS